LWLRVLDRFDFNITLILLMDILLKELTRETNKINEIRVQFT